MTTYTCHPSNPDSDRWEVCEHPENDPAPDQYGTVIAVCPDQEAARRVAGSLNASANLEQVGEGTEQWDEASGRYVPSEPLPFYGFRLPRFFRRQHAPEQTAPTQRAPIVPFHTFDHHGNEYVIEHRDLPTDEGTGVTIWPVTLWASMVTRLNAAEPWFCGDLFNRCTPDNPHRDPTFDCGPTAAAPTPSPEVPHE